MEVTVRTEPNYANPEKGVHVSMAFHWESKGQFINFSGEFSDLMRLIGESVREGVKQGVYPAEGEVRDDIVNILKHHPDEDFAEEYGKEYFSDVIDFSAS